MSVIINGRTAVHAGSNGILTTQDVCLTTEDKIPVTYTNIAKSADADNTAQTVFVDGNPICHQNSIFATSKGDENGDHKGTNSGTIQGQANFVTGSNNVFIEGVPAVRQGDLMVSNNQNTPPAQLQQPGVPPPDAGDDTNQQQLKTPKQPDQINIDVVGINVPGLNATLSAESDSHSILLGKTGEDNGVLKRLEIRNLKSGKYNLYLDNIALGENLATKPSKDQQPEIGQAPNILVTTELRWRTDLDGKPLKPSTGDYTDIARLPSFVRNMVYKDIENYLAQNQTEKPWTQMIKPNTLQLVNEYLQPNKAPELPSGWLYIFKNGELWQELQVINEYGCALPTYLTLPYQINNKINTFEIAYSQIQWSSSRIKYYNDAKNRKNRTDKLELSPFIQKNATVNQTTSKDKNTAVTNMRLLQQYMTPTLFISDPLGLVNRIQTDLTYAWLKLKDLMADAKNDPYFKSALLTYQTYFNPKLAYNQGISEQEYSQILTPYPMTPAQAEQPTPFKAGQDYLDQDKLESILKVKERKALRQRIRALQQAKAKLTQDPNHPLQPGEYNSKLKPLTKFDFGSVDYITVIQDYFAASQAQYYQAFQNLAGLLGDMAYDPSLMDGDLDITPDYDFKQATYGQIYILNLFDKKHILNPKIFPQQNQANKPNDGSGDFRSEDFKSLFDLETSGQVVEVISNALGVFAKSAFKTSNYADTSTSNNIHNNVISLLQATNNQTLSQIKTITSQQQIPDGYVPLGLEPETVEQYVNKYNTIYNNKPLKDVKINTVTIYQASAASDTPAQLIGYESPNIDRDFRGVTMSSEVMTAEKVMSNFTKTRQQSGLNIAIAPKDLMKKTLISADRAFATIFFAFQAYNLGISIKSFITAKGSSKELEGLEEVIASSLYTIYAVEHAAEQFVKEENYIQFFETRSNEFMKLYKKRIYSKIKLTPLGLAGVIASGFSIWFTSKDLLRAVQEGDSGTIIGDFIQISGYGLNALSILGKAAERTLNLAEKEAGEVALEALGDTTTAVLEFLAIFAPYTLAASILILLGTVIVDMLVPHEDDFTKYAKKSPFSDNNENNLTDHEAYAELITLLISPSLELTKPSQKDNKAYLRLAVKFPHFTINQDSLDIRTAQLRNFITDNTNPAVHYDASLFKAKQTLLKPYSVTQLVDKQGRIIGLYYYYSSKIENSNLDYLDINNHYQYTYKSKAKLYVANKAYCIPTPLSSDQSQAKLNDDEILDQEQDPTWLYSSNNPMLDSEM